MKTLSDEMYDGKFIFMGVDKFKQTMDKIKEDIKKDGLIERKILDKVIPIDLAIEIINKYLGGKLKW